MAYLHALQERIDYNFNDVSLLSEALTHDSHGISRPNYQRLEHLGDAVLHTIITEYVYKTEPDANEARLMDAKEDLVCGKMLREIGLSIRISQHIDFASQLESLKFKRYDSFVESMIGAIYLDAGGGGKGLEKVKPIVYKLWKIQDPDSKSWSRYHTCFWLAVFVLALAYYLKTPKRKL